MRYRMVWAAGLLAIFALAVALSTQAQMQAQGKPPIYMYVSLWAVPRAQWADREKVVADNKPVMDKLIADGIISGYGNASTIVHTQGGSTHSNWFTANSVGNLLKALEVVYARTNVANAVAAASNHWDLILTSTNYNFHAGTFHDAYISGAGWDVKPGHESEFNQMLSSSIVPVLENLLARGALHSYGVYTEAIHTAKPGHSTIVYTAVDAAGLDAARNAIFEAISKNPALGPAFGSTVDMDSHRDFLARVHNMTNK